MGTYWLLQANEVKNHVLLVLFMVIQTISYGNWPLLDSILEVYSLQNLRSKSPEKLQKTI